MAHPLNDYPQDITLRNGQSVSLRAMSAADREQILTFARALPQSDLLFLTIDLTEESAVDGWVQRVAAGTTVSLVAYDGDTLIGYATIHRDTAPWTKRVGEIRVNVAPDVRSQGLGRILIDRIYDVARGLGLKKLMARMTIEQRGAQTVFRKLGFVPEAVLADFVEDRNGVSHDLIMMTYDVDGLTDQAGAAVQL